MRRPFQPEWASKEEARLAAEWTSESGMSIDDYVRSHASKRLLREYERQKEVTKNLKRGHEVLPDGDIVVYN